MLWVSSALKENQRKKKKNTQKWEKVLFWSYTGLLFLPGRHVHTLPASAALAGDMRGTLGTGNQRVKMDLLRFGVLVFLFVQFSLSLSSPGCTEENTRGFWSLHERRRLRRMCQRVCLGLASPLLCTPLAGGLDDILLWHAPRL